MIENIKEKLMGKFKMTDMGDVSLVLGMQVTRDRERGTLTNTQENYTKSILDRFGMGSCNALSTPGFGSELSVEQPEETLLNAETPVSSLGPCRPLRIFTWNLLRYLSGTKNFRIT